MRVEDFLKAKFAEYYSRSADSIKGPNELTKREFGFFYFDKDAVIRHMGFENEQELRLYLRQNAPSDAYHSAAYYEDPRAPKMNEKEWLGCDLVFDIDADHIPTPCKQKHDLWKCKNCDEMNKGVKPRKCSKCDSVKIEEIRWVCEECLGVTKDEIVKAVEEYLIPDFGFSKSEIEISFSGHRGYHIHVRKDTIRKMDSQARQEIVDYMKVIGLDLKLHGLYEKVGRLRTRVIVGPRTEDIGWRGRLARMFLSYIEGLKGKTSIEGISETKLKHILENKKEILRGLESKQPFWDSIKGVDIETWYKLIEKAVQRASVRIDEPVTKDVHRLMRLPTSLHGKTGFRVVPLAFSDLEQFDPFKDSQVFQGEIIVHVKHVPEFRIGDEIFGPYKEKKIKIPMSAGIFLLSKGVATFPRGEQFV
ncbi:MAG: DNA primase small subunit domain-containing protein [Promethearchaeota archaeon]